MNNTFDKWDIYRLRRCYIQGVWPTHSSIRHLQFRNASPSTPVVYPERSCKSTDLLHPIGGKKERGGGGLLQQ
jgi:hypothetical protein